MEAKLIYKGRFLQIYLVKSNTTKCKKEKYKKKVKTYKVYWNHSRWSCECEGWESWFEGKDCKHITECMQLSGIPKSVKGTVQDYEKVIQEGEEFVV
jgi:hypothetical protein